jgi:CBS domain-containing protein
MNVSEVMTREVKTVRPDDSLMQAAARIEELDVGMLPVCDGERLVGMLTDRDITTRATAAGMNPRSARVQEVMTADVVYCFEDQDVSEATQLMQEKQIRRLAVLDRSKRLVGVVALGDLATKHDDQAQKAETLETISQPQRP